MRRSAIMCAYERRIRWRFPQCGGPCGTLIRAYPAWRHRGRAAPHRGCRPPPGERGGSGVAAQGVPSITADNGGRAGERGVGGEGRYRGGPGHLKKKKEKEERDGKVGQEVVEVKGGETRDNVGREDQFI